jgi:adenosylcobinamide kinase / adenosylcobinamide-phosphate guanylyltransferase
MHIIFGGAFNGKEQYVKNLCNQQASFYYGALPSDPVSEQEIVVIHHLEQLLQPLQDLGEMEAAATIFKQLIQLDKETTLICICTDMSRGIVPIDKEQRFLRDATGRLYQQLFEQSKSITRIWYGLAEPLKGELTL